MGAAKNNPLEKTNNKQKKLHYRTIIILWLICSILAVITYMQPLETEQKVKINQVRQIMDFSYTSEALPEGIVSLNDVIFTKSQKQIKVNIKALVASDEPVLVKGTSSASIRLVAEELWEKTLQTYPERFFCFKSKETQVIDMETDIDLEILNQELERISEEIIGTRSRNYYLIIKPEVKGEIIFGDVKLPIQNDGEFILSLEGEQVRLAGQKSFVKEFPVEDTRLVKQVYSLFGAELPLVAARYLFTVLSVLLLIMLAIVLRQIKKLKADTISEAVEIDKKYGIRLTSIQSPMSAEGKTNIELQTFKSLVRISDEKDRIILKYDDKSTGQVLYYLVDGDYIYSYKAGSKVKEAADITYEGGNIPYGG